MTISHLKKILLTLFVLPAILLHSQETTSYSDFESLINDQIHAYGLSMDNQFRLAAYTELKGNYSPEYHTLTLDFGTATQLAFYRNNLLLRIGRSEVYHLNRGEQGTVNAETVDRRLNELFDQIPLLSNRHADPCLVYFVDMHLARKNIEPFDKIFLRHILITYGRFNEEFGYVEFDTGWLPEKTYAYRAEGDTGLVRKPISPLRIRLDDRILRGYYVRAGGTVYVEDVRQAVEYATGENYSHNVAAFKLFVQKLFVQSVQYVVRSESERIAQPMQQVSFMPQDAAYLASQTTRPVAAAPVTTSAPKTIQPVRSSVEPLYHAYSWIPMMLGMLRSRSINIGDPDVVRYFIDEPYFPRIYTQLTPEERMRVDAYRRVPDTEAID
ncbi:MAG: hypothetical protein OHK0039_04720 [Bacteroidia bacterium]